MNQNIVSAVLIGAGGRGRESYGRWALRNKDKINFIAVAETNPNRRKLFSEEWDINPERQYESWEGLLDDNNGKLADVCLVCTPDQMHTAPAIKALELGYHVLLEKPMAPSEQECKKLIKVSEETGKQLRICHVLRYTEFFSRVKKAIEDGNIGDIISIQHSENVAYWHFGHSYVRGMYRKAEESTPIILAKTCHDLDLIYYMVDSQVESIHSFGELTHYKSENAPPGTPMRCTDGCPIEDECPWYAPRLYMRAEPLARISQRSKSRFSRWLGRVNINHLWFVKLMSSFIKPLKTLVNWDHWPATVITDDLSPEGKMKALKEGPYGRCIYHCDNNVPDHQVVNIQFKNGVTATMTMQGHSFLDGRWIRIDGTKGTLKGKFTYGGEKLVHYDHRFVKKTVLWERGITFTAHGYGDERLMESFIDSVIDNKTDTLTSARASLESHLMGFAAERSRLENRVVEMAEIQ